MKFVNLLKWQYFNNNVESTKKPLFISFKRIGMCVIEKEFMVVHIYGSSNKWVMTEKNPACKKCLHHKNVFKLFRMYVEHVSLKYVIS